MVIQKLGETVNLFEKKYRDKIFKVKFTNGEKYEFAIDKKNVAHMLSIDTKKLAERLIYKRKSSDFITSYDYIHKILENPDALNCYNEFENGALMNYFLVYESCLAFKKMNELESLNFLGVSFDKNRILSEEDQTKIRSQKLIVYKSNEYLIDYYLLGLIKKDNEKNYSIETNFPVYKNGYAKKWNAKRFIEEQKILLPKKVEKICDRTFNYELEKEINNCESKEELLCFLTEIKDRLELSCLEVEDNNYKVLQKTS